MSMGAGGPDNEVRHFTEPAMHVWPIRSEQAGPGAAWRLVAQKANKSQTPNCFRVTGHAGVDH